MSDITIYIKDREGKKHTVQAPTDMAMNLMEIYKVYELPVEGTCGGMAMCKVYELPVEGTCGGMAMCASCQCYVLSEHELPEMGIDEDLMLAETFYVKENSRLGCQIPITQNLNELYIELAPEV